MSTALTFLGLVVLGALADVLSLAWHYARDAKRTGRMVALGCALELLNAAPFLTVIALGEWWPVAAGVVGSAVGTFIGAKRAPADR